MLSNKQQSTRRTGIDILGDIPWGSHFCLFYETEEDLIDILVPYFKAGLKNNELCVWITSEPLNEKKANDALSGAISDFDRYLKTGQMEIIPHSQWYLDDGKFNLQRALKGGINKLNQALKAGFDGIRITGNSAWLEKTDWENFSDYEGQINVAISKYRMIAICTYFLDECSASDIIDVVSSHKSALIRKKDGWEVIESSERKKAEEALQASEKKYRTLLENIPQKIFLKDKDSVYISCNENYARELKIKANDITGKTDYDFFPKELAHKYRDDDKRVIKSSKTEDINEKYIREGKEVIVHTVKTPVMDELGNVTGILGIFWDITSQRRAQKKLLDYQKRLRDLASEMSLTEERERRRLAIELHDQITQKLILFKINLGSLRQKELPAELSKPLDEIYEDINQIIQDTRSLTFDLGSPTLYELGLEAAIREWLNEEIQQKHGIKTEFKDDGQTKPLDDDVCALLYRAVRELLVNVIKHAKARNVKVAVCKGKNNIYINVVDDGTGFISGVENLTSNRVGGFGLFSIRERLSYLGGSLEIDSKPSKGTRATLVAPIKRKKNNLLWG
jgi:PAS domain S-box-containing protein